MKELRVGIAGLGRLGRVHAANLAHKIPGAILTAACVPGADSQAYARQELGLEKVYGDFREMVADPELDAVAIVSPSGEHCWQIEAALDAGKHVFSEKPLAADMEEGDELIELARKTGLHMGGAPDTFMGAGIQTVRKLVDDGYIGDIVAANCAMTGTPATRPSTTVRPEEM